MSALFPTGLNTIYNQSFTKHITCTSCMCIIISSYRRVIFLAASYLIRALSISFCSLRISYKYIKYIRNWYKVISLCVFSFRRISKSCDFFVFNFFTSFKTTYYKMHSHASNQIRYNLYFPVRPTGLCICICIILVGLQY